MAFQRFSSSEIFSIETTTELLNLTTGKLSWDTIDPTTNDLWEVFVSLIGISIVFLLLSCFVYVIIWEEHNIHGWIQFSYLLSLLSFNIVLIPALLPTITTDDGLCFVLSVLNQFFFICSKTWLLIISIDILKTLRTTKLSLLENTPKKTFVIYIVIGFSLPTLFVLLGITLNLSFRHKSGWQSGSSDLWTKFPDYGHRHCRIPNWNIWEYFVFTNCLVHLFMFCLILYTIFHHLVELSPDNIPESPRSSNKSINLKIYIFIFLRLVIVVGLSWTYIAIQDLLQAGSINTPQSWGWQIFRVLFFLQGVFVTIVYLSNSRTLSLLRSKSGKLNKFVNWVKSVCPWFGKDPGRQSVITISSQVRV